LGATSFTVGGSPGKKKKWENIKRISDDRPDNGGSKNLWNVGKLPYYTAQHPRRQSSYSPP
jgi:hypothetical protein